MLRRATALLLALLFAYSTAESALGAVRDGATHHESDVAAVAHQIEGKSDHGQEGSRPQGTEHRHGGATDHCTHQHSVPLTAASVRVQMASEQFVATLAEPTVRAAHTMEAPFHPPRL